MDTLLEIVAFLEGELARGAASVELDVLDPDQARGHYAGEVIDVAGVRHVHRPLRVWLDLAERLGLRLCTPRVLDPPKLRLRFERLDRTARVRGGEAGTEKYGTDSDFARISKLDDPSFVLDMRDAVERIAPQPSWRVLALGCNTGDEISLLLALSPALRRATHVGIDHSASAIAAARARFSEGANIASSEGANIASREGANIASREGANVASREGANVASRDGANVASREGANVASREGAMFAFHQADLMSLAPLDLGRFDLVLSIGTLQSADLDDRELLRRIVQDHLTPRGAVIIGVPNCRYIDGEVEYGARMKNFRQPELGLLVKDVAFYRKYLAQHHKQVFVTGKHYLLVTAIPTE